MKAKLSKEKDWYDLYRINEYGKRFTFAYTQDFKQKLSLKNCQAIERGYDLDELAEKACPDIISSAHSAFKAGFQKALELNSTKLFTLEDMMNCWNKALKFQDHKETLGEHIQSLQQTEWNCIIEMELEIDTSKLVGAIYGQKPKLDADGCLILKLKSE